MIGTDIQTAAMAIVGVIWLSSTPLLIWMVSRVLKRLDDLNSKVGIQNGRVGKLEVWKELFEDGTNRAIDRIQRDMDEEGA